jgi:hypothetical protein
VLGRAELSGGARGRPLRGTLVAAAARAGRRVAWIEVSPRRGRVVQRVVVADARRGRILRRLVVASPARRTATAAALSDLAYLLSVAVTPAGDLAWVANRSSRDATATEAVLARAGRPRRILARKGFAVGFEDERTVRWASEQGGVVKLQYRDFAPPTRPGCPRRGRFRASFANDVVVASTADYADPLQPDNEFAGATVVRACLRATGEDPIISQGSSDTAGGSGEGVIGAYGRWAVLAGGSSNRYDGCTGRSLRTVRLPDLLVGRGVSVPCGSFDALPPLPASDAPLVVTDPGAPVWLARSADADRVVAVVPGRFVELDRARPGAVANLRVDGERVLWSVDGEPRRAVP